MHSGLGGEGSRALGGVLHAGSVLCSLRLGAHFPLGAGHQPDTGMHMLPPGMETGRLLSVQSRTMLSL